MSGTRADRLEAALAEHEVDALLVTNLVNVRWLCGFTGSNAAAIVGPGRRAFITDFRYLTQAADQVGDAWEHRIAPDLLARAAEELRDAAPLRLGFDDTHLTVKQHARLHEQLADGVELVAAGGVVEGLRAVKEPDEIERIRAAAKVADAAFTEVILEGGIVGRTERDIALELEIAMRRRGASGVSFSPIVAAAAHGALPHAEPRDVPIPANTLVVVDWGAQMDGYASDCTRTVATGDLDPRDRDIYDLVLRAQEAALAAVRPGPTGREVDAVARTIIDEAGHAEHFGHGLGHGVGMEVHEGPRLSKLGETALVPGHVVTVEPGVYLPGRVGVRIEDLVAVTEDGADVLNGLPKALTVVP
ncbi:Xaa-Pro peptidase family protein [Svornostia abyssi]|uniref:Xaa-Pro peptidase family protein n=1 Tax=Svornostia abyssi TaxID=2898438 RepID=A0ABY5PD74_9ACTN|nr:Xaa-Pro peptidase family protein [Parviterribacteraceae bacterium J379]